MFKRIDFTRQQRKIAHNSVAYGLLEDYILNPVVSEKCERCLHILESTNRMPKPLTHDTTHSMEDDLHTMAFGV